MLLIIAVFSTIFFIAVCLALHAWTDRIREEVKYRLKDVLIDTSAHITYKRQNRNYTLIMLKIDNKDIALPLKINITDAELINILNIGEKFRVKMKILNFEPIFSSWTLFVNSKYKHYLKTFVIEINGVEYCKGFKIIFY